jgi:hypothetical protein
MRSISEQATTLRSQLYAIIFHLRRECGDPSPLDCNEVEACRNERCLERNVVAAVWCSHSYAAQCHARLSRSTLERLIQATRVLVYQLPRAFWLDLYLSDSLAVFVPPPPFTLDELDPVGVILEEPYTKEQLQNYLTHARNKCRMTIAALSELRHVQHHAAQLNVLLRQNIGSAPHWVAQAKEQSEA